MFGLKNILSKTSFASVKPMASNSFLDTMTNINQVKNNAVRERDDKRLEESNSIFYEAKNKMSKCISTNNFDKIELKEISNLFIKSIEFNRNNQEAYVFLSKIFYILGNNKLSAKYLKMAKFIYNNNETDKLSEVISNAQIITTKNVPEPLSNNQNIENLRKKPLGVFPTSLPTAKTNIFNRNLMKK